MTTLILLLTTLAVFCFALCFFPYFSAYILGPGALWFVVMLTITRPEYASAPHSLSANPADLLQTVVTFILSYGLILGFAAILGGALRIERIENAGHGGQIAAA